MLTKKSESKIKFLNSLRTLHLSKSCSMNCLSLESKSDLLINICCFFCFNYRKKVIENISIKIKLFCFFFAEKISSFSRMIHSFYLFSIILVSKLRMLSLKRLITVFSALFEINAILIKWSSTRFLQEA